MTALSNITVFDFETSGLDPQKERIIEIAAIRVRNGQIVSEFSTLVKNGPVEEKITELTGITNDQLLTGLGEDSAMRIFKQFMDGSTLVAHNAPFDLAFLHFTRMRLFERSFDNDFLDTLTISRDRYTFPHKLTDMCGKLEIELTGAHRALNDVIGCWELLKKLHADGPVDQYVNQLGYLNKYGPPKWVPEYAILHGQDNKYEPREAVS